MKTIEEKLSELKKTIPFKWRVQSTYPKVNPTHAIMIPYVDARDIDERLDEVIGASGWQNDFKVVDNKLFGGIGIYINDQWVWKWDVGTASQTEKEKGMASDAYKRSAVHWGINREAYQIGTVKIKVKEYQGKHYPCDESGNFLKGTKLYDNCNKLAKISELEGFDIEITKEYFSETNFDATFENLMVRYESLKTNLSESEKLSAERILLNKEENSYKKLSTLFDQKL